MLIDLWHHWLLLRALLVFALAGPLLVLALLVSGPGRPRRSEPQTDAAPAAPSTPTEARFKHPSEEQGVAATPRQWRAASDEADRRAA